MRRLKDIAAVLVLAGAVLGGVAGCEEEGSAEKAGKKLDKAVEGAADAMKK